MTRAYCATFAACCVVVSTLPAAGQEDHSAHHAALASPARYAVSEARYSVPDVALLDARGRSAQLRALLEPDRPIALNFVFTTCTTICPVMTATFAQARRELGADASRVRFLSLSIDPDQDRPPALERYGERYAVGQGWTLLTGASPDVKRVLQAFAADFGSKLNHRPVTLLRAAHAEAWTRIDGLASGAELAAEVRARLLR